MIDQTDGCAAFHRSLDELEKWVERNVTKFNNRKHGVLYLGRNNLVPSYRLGVDRLESSLDKKVWEGHRMVVVISWWTSSCHEQPMHQCGKEGFYHPGKCSQFNWLLSWAPCLVRQLSETGIGLSKLQRGLLTSAIL